MRRYVAANKAARARCHALARVGQGPRGLRGSKFIITLIKIAIASPAHAHPAAIRAAMMPWQAQPPSLVE